MIALKQNPSNKRLGYHYFSDTNHFRQVDLQTWLPILTSLEASWLTIESPLDRAIPENFIRTLKENSIEPIIQFQPPQYPNINFDFLPLLLQTYKKWGASYVTFTLKPNLKKSWTFKAWTQENIIDCFLFDFLNFARLSINEHLFPIFPNLEPGGDFWDIAFLELALNGLKKKDDINLFDRLIIGAQATLNKNLIEWGQGGPARWTEAQPYFTPENSQDHCGFFIYEWYSAIIKRVLGTTLPIILFNSGYEFNDSQAEGIDENLLIEHTNKNLRLIQYIVNNDDEINGQKFASEVIACNFPLLNFDPNKPQNNTWIQPNGTWLPIVEAIDKWLNQSISLSNNKSRNSQQSNIDSVSQKYKNISHYLLLPIYDWGIAEWEWDAIKPYILKNHPTVGFCLEEAIYANKVTVFTNDYSKNRSDIEKLSEAGCIVEILNQDGVIIDIEK